MRWDGWMHQCKRFLSTKNNFLELVCASTQLTYYSKVQYEVQEQTGQRKKSTIDVEVWFCYLLGSLRTKKLHHYMIMRDCYKFFVALSLSSLK